MAFHDAYKVKSGDTLIKIGKSKGYANPGPIVAYGPNKQYFRTHSPNQIRAGDAFLIPWCPELLRKFIVTMEHLIKQVTETANSLIEGEKKNREDLEQFLVMIDSINMIAQINVSIGALALESAGAMAGKHGATEAEGVLEWLADNRVHLYAGDLAPLLVPQPEAPKKDYRFFIRHTLGPWTPSFWASVWTAIKTKDMDLYLYGSQAVTYRNSKLIADNAQSEIRKLSSPLEAARRQMTLPCYAYKV